ncbi:hypothetical protein KCP71_18470 [Salmonella enterica subsp. enterica]|nr:hypothetical protein KCP71_18470 [Salmonella enterica subsp. enterica]
MGWYMIRTDSGTNGAKSPSLTGVRLMTATCCISLPTGETDTEKRSAIAGTNRARIREITAITSVC